MICQRSGDLKWFDAVITHCIKLILEVYKKVPVYWSFVETEMSFEP